MQIQVVFEKNWTVGEIKEFLVNPDAEKFTSLSDRMYIELIACAEAYATRANYGDYLDQYEMIRSAQDSIADGIDEHFFDEMFDGYYEYYATYAALHLPAEAKKNFMKRMRINISEETECSCITRLSDSAPSDKDWFADVEEDENALLNKPKIEAAVEAPVLTEAEKAVLAKLMLDLNLA